MNMPLDLVLSAASDESQVTVWTVLQGAVGAAIITGVFGLLFLIVDKVGKYKDSKRQDAKDLKSRELQDRKDIEELKLTDARAAAAAVTEEKRRQAERDREDALRTEAVRREDQLAADALRREDELAAAQRDRQERAETLSQADRAGREMLVALRQIRSEMGAQGAMNVRQEVYLRAADLALMLPNRDAALYFFIDIQNAYDIVQIGYAEGQQENNGAARWEALKWVLQRASDYVVSGHWQDEWLPNAKKMAKDIEDAWEERYNT